MYVLCVRLTRVFGMISATEINALRLEIVDGLNQFLKLPLISYVIDNTKAMINQVIMQYQHVQHVPILLFDL